MSTPNQSHYKCEVCLQPFPRRQVRGFNCVGKTVEAAKRQSSATRFICCDCVSNRTMGLSEPDKLAVIAILLSWVLP